MAMEAGGSSVIEAGFGILGQVAMEELMRNEQVSDAMSDVADYIDMAQLEAVLQQN